MTKTYTVEEMRNYIDCAIRDMKSSYMYASGDVVARHGAENAQRWFRQWIDEERAKGFGALQFALIFLKGIDEDDYRELYSKLDEAYNYWYDKSWEIRDIEEAE